MDTPRIYVASLSDYNNGNLHGAWIEINKTVEEISEAIQAILATSRYPIAEEWAIHDYELPGGIRISEWEQMAHVSALGLALEQAGDQAEALAVWYANCEPGDDVKADADDLVQSFQSAFMGTGDSFKGWITDNDVDVLNIDSLKAFIADAEKSHFGPKWASEAFEELTYNIDWDMVARDQESYYNVVRYDGTVYIFSQS